MRRKALVVVHGPHRDAGAGGGGGRCRQEAVVWHRHQRPVRAVRHRGGEGLHGEARRAGRVQDVREWRAGVRGGVAGSLDAGMVSEFIFVPARAKGAQISLVSLFTVTGKDLGAVVSKNIKSPKDLEGKTSATAIRTSAEYFMYRYFEKHGIDVSQGEGEEHRRRPRRRPRLFRGDIDGFFLWGNWVPKAAGGRPAARGSSPIPATTTSTSRSNRCSSTPTR